MIRSLGIVLVAALAVLMLMSAPVMAATGSLAYLLFNTGVDGSGKVMAPAAANLDTHYILVDNPNTAVVDVAYATTNANGAWIPNDPVGSYGSSWIGPTDNNNISNYQDAAGPWVYEYKIDLSPYSDVSGAYFAGRWSTDNDAVMKILVNTVDVTTFTQYKSWNPFSFDATAGLVSGVNTVQFIVQNPPPGQYSYNPTGLRVEWTVGTIPEPVFFQFGALMGLSGLGVLRLRRKA